MNEYIRKDKALYFMNHNDKVVHYLSRTAENIVDRTTQAICQVISEMPAADVQPVKHGRWSECYTDTHHYSGICSICGKASIKSLAESLYAFCPKCGARMDGET